MFSYVDRDRTWLKADQPEMQFSLFLRRSCRSCRGPQRRRRSRGREGSPAGPAARLRHLAPATRPRRPDGRPAPGSTFSFQYLHCPARVASIGRFPPAAADPFLYDGFCAGQRGCARSWRPAPGQAPGSARPSRRPPASPQRGAGAGSSLGLWPGHGAGGGRIEPGRRPPGGGAERG
jgi:hypothetical protein